MRSLTLVASALLLSAPSVFAAKKGGAAAASGATSAVASSSAAAVPATASSAAPAAGSSTATTPTTTNVCQGGSGGNYTLANPQSLLTDLSCDTVNKWGSTNYPKQDVVASPPTSSSNPWYPSFQAWTNTYTAAVAAGEIPALPPSTLKGGVPTYTNGPTNSDAKNGTFCAWSFNGCVNKDFDIWEAPAGIWGLTFDDGPQPNSTVLYDFLDQKLQPATHFLIGSRIVQFPAKALQAYNQGQHLCVHTYSHHYMTTLTDTQVIGELGWTVALMKDLFGVTPNCWRPPYGDVDNRVRAIAKSVFNMTTIIWNEDPDDWCMVDTSNDPTTAKTTCPGTNYQTVTANLTNWAAASTKYVGANYGPLVLEHELSYASIEAFINSYPAMIATLKVEDIAQLSGMSYYQEGTPSFAQALANGQDPASAAASAAANPSAASVASASVATASAAALVASASSSAAQSSTTTSSGAATGTPSTVKSSANHLAFASPVLSGVGGLVALTMAVAFTC